MIGERGRPVVVWCEAVAETMFKVTNIVMHYAPIGVGAAIAYTVGHGSIGVLWNLAWLVATLYLAMAVFILGVPRRIVAFVLPLGYSFNLDGSTLYLSLAAIFVAQAAGIELTIGQQIMMMLPLEG